MTSESLKTLGNQAFAAGNYTDAIEHFSAAIAVDPENHVLYSNRSAAYSSLKDYKSAAADAEKTVSIKPDWAKGFSRKGAALHGLGNMEGACEAYKQGLKIDPENALLKKGLEDVESAMESDALGGIGNVFGPDMWAKLAANPKVSHLLAQPDLVQKLQDIQKNPKNMGMYMQDQRIMQIMMSLMGLDAQMASTPEELEKATEQAHENLEKSKSETKHVPEPVVEEQISPEEKAKKTKREASDNEKQLGNEFYKKRKFEDALTHYDAAWNLDETNVAVLTNKAAVLFEMENYTECIAVSEKAVETARDLRADYKLIGR